MLLNNNERKTLKAWKPLLAKDGTYTSIPRDLCEVWNFVKIQVEDSPGYHTLRGYKEPRS